MLNDIVLFLLSEVVGWCELRLKGAILLWIRRVVRLRMKLQRKQSGDCLFQWKKLYLYCTAYVPPLITKAPQGETALNYRFLLVKLLFFNTLFPLY